MLPKPSVYASDRAQRGAYSDNAFCTMRCAYAFGVTAAKLGFRLEKTT